MRRQWLVAWLGRVRRSPGCGVALAIFVAGGGGCDTSDGRYVFDAKSASPDDGGEAGDDGVSDVSGEGGRAATVNRGGTSSGGSDASSSGNNLPTATGGIGASGGDEPPTDGEAGQSTTASSGGATASSGGATTTSGGGAPPVVGEEAGAGGTAAEPTAGVAGVPATSMFKLMLSTVGIAAAQGTAAANPVGASCGTGCSSYPPGEVVVLTAAGSGNALIGGWSGDCAGTGATCTLTMSADKVAVAHFRPNMNIMFVSSRTIPPYQIGSDLANADRLCSESAADAHLGGTRWKAWLSTSAATTNINAATHVGASTTGWIRVDGRPFSTSMADLLASKIFYPPILTELNTDRKQEYAVVTGTFRDGQAAPDGTCGDWTSATGSTWNGRTTTTSEGWTFSFVAGGNSCGETQTPVYCFQNDPGMAAVPAPVVPPNGRRAFVSKTLWLPGGGAAAADTVCQNDATTAGLANASAYRALLTTTVAATDSSRISVSGQPWFRLDGAQLLASAGDLAAPTADKMLTSLNVDSSGAYLFSYPVWTGNAVAPSATTMVANCSNWTTSAASVSSSLGIANITEPYWWANNTQPCSSAANLYCFER
jgi:hypothetical protein